MWLLYVKLPGEQYTRACVSRYDQSAWTVRRSSKWCRPTYCSIGVRLH